MAAGLAIAGAAVALLVAGTSCTSDTSEPPAMMMGNANARELVLASVAENVILPTYQEFLSAALALEEATAAQVTDPSQLSVSQEAWASTIAVWQRAELFQVGPAGAMDGVAGGEDIRDDIYSWPLTNRCRIDQEIADEGYSDMTMLRETAVNVRGLDTLEYLLFVASNENNCAPNSRINRDGTWAALDEAALASRRAAYGAALATLVREKAEELVNAWDPAQGNFVGSLSNPTSGTVYASPQEALNALSDALFYIESETKDMKLAEPAGITNCEEATCPDARESRFANRSREHVLENLRSFQRAYFGAEPGTDAYGFDDLLREIGAEEVATAMETALEGAISTAEQMSSSFAEVLGSDVSQLIALHDAVKGITDVLKTQFIGVLDLELPKRVEGDND
ncbi:MAG: imelysin family protein [Myxococcota bacterium]